MSSAALLKLSALIDERGLDGVLISAPHNRRYFSGYSAEDHAADESAGVLLIANDRQDLFTSSVNAGWAESEAPAFAVRTWARPWEASIAARLKELGWGKVGFEDRVLPVATLQRLRDTNETITWTALGGAVDELRARKSPEEIEFLATAITLTDQVFTRVAADIRAGDKEAEIAWRVERTTREETPGTVAFPPIVASGPHGARPHHAASDRRISLGEPIVIDMGVAYRGYNGDLTRTIWLGEANERLSAVYNAVLAAQLAAMRAIRPGVVVKTVDQAARDVLDSAGFGEYILHSVGHGLGLRVHEAPSVSRESEQTLDEGHVVTVEPGVYIQDWGGVRIEDVVVVTADGFRNLTTSEKRAI